MGRSPAKNDRGKNISGKTSLKEIKQDQRKGGLEEDLGTLGRYKSRKTEQDRDMSRKPRPYTG